MFYIIPTAVVLLLLIVPFASIRIVQQYQRGVLISLGRVIGVKEPGLQLIIPFIQKIFTIDMQIQVLGLGRQQVITRDSVSMVIEAVVYYQVVDPQLNYIKLDDDDLAIAQLGQAIMRKTVGAHALTEILEHGETVSDAIQSELGSAALDWGLQITRIELKDVELPEGMRRAMASQAEAVREAAAKVTAAEGEKNSAELLREAAELLSPVALELRRLQTLALIGTDNAAVVVVSQSASGAEIAAQAAAGTLAAQRMEQ